MTRAQCLPDDVVEAFGEPYEGVLDSGVHIPADAEQEIIAALEARGYRCTEDTALAEMFALG